MSNPTLETSQTGVFYNSNPSTSGYEGSLEYATTCNYAKYKGTFRLEFRVTREQNEGACTYTGDSLCESRCSVRVTPKSCAGVDDCHVQFTYTIGERR